jgi:hypothetical protein
MIKDIIPLLTSKSNDDILMAYGIIYNTFSKSDIDELKYWYFQTYLNNGKNTIIVKIGSRMLTLGDMLTSFINYEICVLHKIYK